MISLVVLAGGLATRIRPLTETIPKSMIEINDRPFVLYQLDLLVKNGIDHVHYCLGYLGEQVENELRKYAVRERLNIRLSFSYDGTTLLGTGGAIVKALPHLSDSFFITYGDSYLDTNFDAIHAHYLNNASHADAIMTVFKNDHKWDKSNVEFDGSLVLEYSKKNNSSRMRYIDYGLSIVKKNHFSSYSAMQMFDLSEIFEKLSGQRMLLGYEVTERFYEIGSFDGIKDFTNFIKNKP